MVKGKKKSTKKSKSLIIGCLLAMIVFMSVGYAALAQSLNINGTANISADWKVEITGIESSNLVGATVTEKTFSTTSATFNVDLAYPGSTATFEVAIKNGGTINAKLESIVGLDAVNASVPAEIQYEVTGVAIGDKLAAGESDTAIVTVKWVSKADNTDKIPDVTTKTATITLNYVQDTE